jgi:lysophospholipase L1-like esterase
LFGNLFNVELVNAQLKIMPLGDSITEGVMRMMNPTGTKTLSKIAGLEGLTPEGVCGVLTSGEGGYRTRLGQLLNDKNWDFEFVGRKYDVGGYHEGYAGYMTSDILYILNEALNVNLPDVVLIHIGTNDLPWPINPDSCYVNINKIIDTIHNFDPGIKVILAQIIPCLQNIELGVKRYPKIIELNDLLPQIPLERSHVTLVDMWHPFVNTPDWETELMSGTWHPSPRGYRLMADKWSDGLDQAIDGRSPLVKSNC